MSSYGLTAENFLRALPDVLQQDERILALASAVADALEQQPDEIAKVLLYPAIDTMPEALLNILAYDFKIDWWNENWSLDRKRQSLKDSWLIHKRLGTPYAVNLAIQAAFGAGELEEWFDYGGDPHHFRVVGLGPEMAQTGYEAFLKLLVIVKRASSVLDAVVMRSTHEMDLHAGFCAVKTDHKTVNCVAPSTEVVYLVDENEDMLADEDGARYIDDEEE